MKKKNVYNAVYNNQPAVIIGRCDPSLESCPEKGVVFEVTF
jgi:hypothetical protein